MGVLTRIGALGVLVATMVGMASAASYYVDPSGDDAGPGTSAAPWATIQHAATQMLPGDTVIVRPGIYAESVAIAGSGTAGAVITYQAVPGAVLESPDPSASLSAFDVQAGVGYLILDGFEARGGFHETIFLRTGAHDIAIRNCNVHDNRAGIWIGSARGIEVTGCRLASNTAAGMRIFGTSQDITVQDTTSEANDDGLGCSGDADGFVAEQDSVDITFINCLALGNSEDGFDLKGDRVLVARSESRDNGCAGVKLWRNGRVENAIVTGNKTGVVTTSPADLSTSIEIVNSTVADNGGTQLLLRRPANGGDPVMYDVVVRNVIAAGPAKAIEVEAGVGLIEDHNVMFREDTTSGVLVQHLTSGETRRYSGQKINSGVWTAESGQGEETWAIKPDFLDFTAYRVAADSVAIDGGVGDGAPSDDRDGQPRPQGTATDGGAYETVQGVTNHRPWADPGPDRTTRLGKRVNFTGYGSVDPDGDTLSYRWDFGDASPSGSGYAVSHVYEESGELTVTLTVSDGQLERSRTAAVSVTPAGTTAEGFKCYKVKDLKEPKFEGATVSLADQFEDRLTVARKPFVLCNPVGVQDPASHLTCYKIKNVNGQPKHVRARIEVEDAFGTIQLETLRELLLCAPSVKTLLP